MRVTLIAVGSTGDVQPMVVLGKTLIARGHTVTLAAFSALEPLVADSGIAFAPLPGDAARYIGSIVRPGANPLTYLSRLKSALGDVAGPLLDAMLAAMTGADAAVCTFFAAVPYMLCEHLQIPLIQSNYCLTDMTGAYCLPVMAQPRLGPLTPAFNRATYRVAYRMIRWVERRVVVPWAHARGIRPRVFNGGPQHTVSGRAVPVLYAVSPHVLPLPEDFPPGITATGYWEQKTGAFDRDPALEAFLDAGEVPVYIGFGSMTAGDMEHVLGMVLEALNRCGLRAVLSRGWSRLAGVALPETVHMQQSYVAHHWLFARVRAVVHHGGAGTTAAGLEAGRPTLVVPFGSDQFFWGNRVHALGCGPKPLPRTKLNTNRLAGRLHAVVSSADYAENARRIGSLLRKEDGAAAAADCIERVVHAWSGQGR